MSQKRMRSFSGSFVILLALCLLGHQSAVGQVQRPAATVRMTYHRFLILNGYTVAYLYPSPPQVTARGECLVGLRGITELIHGACRHVAKGKWVCSVKNYRLLFSAGSLRYTLNQKQYSLHLIPRNDPATGELLVPLSAFYRPLHARRVWDQAHHVLKVYAPAVTSKQDRLGADPYLGPSRYGPKLDRHRATLAWGFLPTEYQTTFLKKEPHKMQIDIKFRNLTARFIPKNTLSTRSEIVYI